MRKIYIAASFAYKNREKTEERKREIEWIVTHLKELIPEDHFYLPHQLKIPNAWDMSLEEWSKAVFDHDFKALDEADIVIFISWGKENNSGSVWETGYAYAKEKPVIVVKMTDEPESLMITNTAQAFVRGDLLYQYDWKTLPREKCSLTDIS